MTDAPTPIVLDLHGTKAPRGVDLDGLQGFIKHFRAALRDYDRSASARDHEVGRGGQPGARSKAVTAFRVVRLSIGSAVMELQEVSDLSDGLPLPIDGTATANLFGFLDAIEREELDPGVVDSLEAARRALGADGSFGVEPEGRRAKVTIDAPCIERIRNAVSVEPQSHPVTVSGRLHLIEVEEPFRVEIRATDGVNWTCTYDDDLEPVVLSLVKNVVWARGVGRRLKGNRGSMELREIRDLPRFEQSPLFTEKRVPDDELDRSQGVVAPQGLRAVQDDEAVDDEASRAFLDFILEDAAT